ncbi:hypothetical protein LSTR_LSTR007074 [Laodelphax striatellus]|uniref:Uncharacterized protein n=1 Tax=Laodelphax striatellus TaxID=195883 RepID=A0A482WKC7_LAOST|nr:hypothetical protein LSTR_LSTR007074 [Laodelphax striatellus]
MKVKIGVTTELEGVSIPATEDVEDIGDEELVDHLMILGDKVEELDPRFKNCTKPVVQDFFLEHLDDLYRNPSAIYPKTVSRRCKACRSHCDQNKSQPGCRVTAVKMVTPVKVQLSNNVWLRKNVTSLIKEDGSLK